jgi:hypothetical protein
MGHHGVDADGGQDEEERAEDDEHPRRNPAQDEVPLDVFAQRAHVEHGQGGIDLAHEAAHGGQDRHLRARARTQMDLAGHGRTIPVRDVQHRHRRLAEGFVERIADDARDHVACRPGSPGGARGLNVRQVTAHERLVHDAWGGAAASARSVKSAPSRSAMPIVRK